MYNRTPVLKLVHRLPVRLIEPNDFRTNSEDVKKRKMSLRISNRYAIYRLFTLQNFKINSQ